MYIEYIFIVFFVKVFQFFVFLDHLQEFTRSINRNLTMSLSLSQRIHNIQVSVIYMYIVDLSCT